VGTTTYYVSQVNTATTCEGPRATLVVTINPIPGAPTGTGAPICGSGTANLTASGCTGTYKWYDVATGGTSIGTGATFTTPNISATTTYYVSCTSAAGCEGPRTAVIATVNPIPTDPTVTPNSRCGTGTVVLSAAGCTGGTLNWFNAATGGSSLGTGTTFTTPSLTTTTTYYVSCTINGCTSGRTPVTATINPIPGAPNGIDGTSCGPGPVLIGASGCTGTYTWYDVATGGTAIGTGSSFNTPPLSLANNGNSASYNFYVSCISAAGCEGPRTTVQATVRPVDPGSIAADQTICAGQDPVAFTGVAATSLKTM
jgi:hypothetical protein